MSPTATEEQDAKVLDLTQRMADKNKTERAAMLRAFMQEHYGVDPVGPSSAVELSPEQFERMMSGLVSEAKKVTTELTESVAREHNLSVTESRVLAEQEVGSLFRKNMNYNRDLGEIAKVLRALSHAAVGKAKPGELEAAYDAERKYLKDTNRESRAMGMGTDSTGGYIGGELFDTLLYDNVARVSQARKYCTLVNMTKEIYRLPKLSSTFTATQDSEAGTISSSQWVLDQFVLNTKKLTVLSKPFSVELMEVADPALVQSIIQFATIEIAKKEDSLVFSTSGTGILGQSTNNVILGGAADSGKTAITDVDFDDMHNLINELDEQYLPDEDIKGSGLIGGEARFWVPRTVINVLAKSKGNDNYHWANVQELKMGKRVHGFEVKRVVSMSQAPAANTRFMALGNLAHVWCGVRPGYRIELMSQGSVDSVNLNETNSYALRVTEFFDNDCIDDEAFAIAKTATT